MAMVANIYKEMNDAVRAGGTLTEAQKVEHEKIGGLLKTYFTQGCFEADDSNMDIARKYGQIFGYQIAVLGLEKATEELLKPGLAAGSRKPEDEPSPTSATSARPTRSQLPSTPSNASSARCTCS